MLDYITDYYTFKSCQSVMPIVFHGGIYESDEVNCICRNSSSPSSLLTLLEILGKGYCLGVVCHCLLLVCKNTPLLSECTTIRDRRY